MAALGWLVLAPAMTWALGEDAGGCSSSNTHPPVDEADRESQEHLGLLLAPRQFVPTFALDGVGSQPSCAGLASSTNNPDPDPVEDRKQWLKVNAITGLVTTSESNYSPLTESERWKLYFKMN